jgi:hypothetical protein
MWREPLGSNAPLTRLRFSNKEEVDSLHKLLTVVPLWHERAKQDHIADITSVGYLLCASAPQWLYVY